MGPLAGITVIEIASLAPGSFCGMLLGDLGADVVLIDRVPGPRDDSMGRGLLEPLLRNRRSLSVNLKASRGSDLVLRLAEDADVLIEGFRPGVAERLGIGPAPCLERNPGLVYGRITGWGRGGPLARTAGHDLDYLAVSGALHAIGRAGEPPLPPLNLVADFGGGGMLLALGVVAALWERQRSGRGQVVDAAMVDGAALQATLVYGLLATGRWRDERGVNLLDGGAPFYDTYPTADGGYLAVAALEPRFFAELLEGLGLDPTELPGQYDRERWPELRARLADAVAARSRREWEEVFEGTDACAAPVLTLGEAPRHPHNRHRGTFVGDPEAPQPAPAPRFDRTPTRHPGPAPGPGDHTDELLTAAGLGPGEIAALRDAGVVA